MKKRVLIPLYYYDPYVSGVSVYAKHIAEGLVKIGYEVTILTARFERTLPKKVIINGVKVVRRPVLLKLGKGVVMPLYWLDIVWYARQHEIVNAHLPLAESGLASLFIPKHKIITTYQCDINLGPRLLDRIITKISLALMGLQLERSRAIVVLNQDYINHSKMKRFAHKAVPIYAPIASDDFKPTSSDIFFRKRGIATRTIKIGFLGRIVYEKGIEFLLACIPYLEKTFNDFIIVVGGDFENVAGGSIKDTLDEFIRKYPKRIVFTGFLAEDDKPKFYSGLDVFVLPSIDPLEAFGMVQVEALLCGTPIIASDLPGVREVVRVTGFGKISKVADPQDIAKQIKEVISHTSKYKPKRARVEKIFNTRETIEAYNNLFQA